MTGCPNSLSEAVFEAAIPVYQESLERSGYAHKLKFQPGGVSQSSGSRRNRTRSRNITWFNPPYSVSVETQIGKEFMKLIEAFPRSNILAPMITKNNIKMSYKCMKNVAQHINSHNNKILREPVTVAPAQPRCSCQASNKFDDLKKDCPLPGQCDVDSEGKVESVIYNCEVTRSDTGASETYIGLTGGTFKARWYGHLGDIRRYDKNNPKQGTALSRHIGKLRSENIPYKIKWKIIQRAPTFNPITNSCRLCLYSRNGINYPKMSSLNENHKLFQTCLLRKGLLLKKS